MNPVWLSIFPKLQLLGGHCLAPYKVILQQSRMRMAVARGSGTERRRPRNRTDNRCGCGRGTVWTPLPPLVPPLRISRFRNGSPILLAGDPLVLNPDADCLVRCKKVDITSNINLRFFLFSLPSPCCLTFHGLNLYNYSSQRFISEA